jgi:hypothetical protein
MKIIHFIHFSSVNYSTLISQRKRSVRDLIKSDARLGKNAIVPFHPCFYLTYYLPNNPATCFDSSPLAAQDIFTFIFCALIKNRIKAGQQPLFHPSPVFHSCPQFSLKPMSGLVPTPVPVSTEGQLDRVRD